MKILYVFPHPDDESFGPAAVIHQQIAAGHDVYLLTLTKGEATKVRFELGISKAEMADIRFKEMQNVKAELKLTGMDVLDFPDYELCELDPRILENIVRDYIEKWMPDVVVTYAVNGISGFHDHLVCHHVVKRVFCEIRESGHPLRRLAMFTLPDEGGPTFQDGAIRIKHSPHDRIDCVISLTDTDHQKMLDCLNCYQSYQGVIEESGVKDRIGQALYFEFYDEDFTPALKSITANMPDLKKL